MNTGNKATCIRSLKKLNKEELINNYVNIQLIHLY
jgi:hypothetical protein